MSDKEDSHKTPAKKKKKGSQERKTFRCKVEVDLSDSSQYSHVNWLDLVAKEAAKERKKNAASAANMEKGQEEDNGGFVKPGGLDPYASDDEDQLKALAAQFEKKYAEPGAAKKKGVKRRRGKEYDDLGDGYDESDPFIDNSECFDEVVPPEITTAHGGFYINVGVLEFKDNKQNIVYELSDTSESDCETSAKKPAKIKKEKVVGKKAKAANGSSGFIPGPGAIPVKKAKVINTQKRRARIIKTDVNKRGPKSAAATAAAAAAAAASSEVKIIGEKHSSTPTPGTKPGGGSSSSNGKLGGSNAGKSAGAKSTTTTTSTTTIKTNSGAVAANAKKPEQTVSLSQVSSSAVAAVGSLGPAVTIKTVKSSSNSSGKTVTATGGGVVGGGQSAVVAANREAGLQGQAGTKQNAATNKQESGGQTKDKKSAQLPANSQNSGSDKSRGLLLAADKSRGASPSMDKSSPKPRDLMDLEAQLNVLSGGSTQAFGPKSSSNSSSGAAKRGASSASSNKGATASSAANSPGFGTIGDNKLPSSISIAKLPATCGISSAITISRVTTASATQNNHVMGKGTSSSATTPTSSSSAGGVKGGQGSLSATKSGPTIQGTVRTNQDGGRSKSDKNSTPSNMYNHIPSEILSQFSPSTAGKSSLTTTYSSNSSMQSQKSSSPVVSSSYSLNNSQLSHNRISLSPSTGGKLSQSQNLAGSGQLNQSQGGKTQSAVSSSLAQTAAGNVPFSTGKGKENVV